MNQMISHSEQQIQIPKIDAMQIINFLQFASASGFSKNYAPKLQTEVQKREFLNTVNFMISDLTEEQLQAGVLKLRDSGFCPDLNLFRRWCLGLDGFDTIEDKIRKTYLGSDSALAHIINFNRKQSDFMTNAMELAYQDTYLMFLDMETSEKPEYLLLQVHRSFKQCYEDHVNKLVQAGIEQIIYEPKTAIERKKKPKDISNFIDNSYRPYG